MGLAMSNSQDLDGPDELIEDLRVLTRQLVGWRLDELETDPDDAVRIAARQRVADLLGAAKNVFDRVIGSTSKERGSGAWVAPAAVAQGDHANTFLDQVERSVEDHSNSAAADIAFIAKLEIQGLSREVSVVARDLDGWRLLELCERVRRHIVKATTALRRTLRPEQGLGQDEIYVTELVRSIQVRRRLAIFRRQVMDAGEAHPHQPWPRLRMVGTSIAVLICRLEYRDFRIGDRMLIRGLQRVLLEHLAEPTNLPQRGQRIWQDVLGALEIMQQVNRRPELLEHDYIMLEDLERRLGQAGSECDLAELRDLTQSIIGRDEELDRLICSGCVSLEQWRSVVTMAREALEQHRAPSGAHDEILAANAEAARSGSWNRRSLTVDRGT